MDRAGPTSSTRRSRRTERAPGVGYGMVEVRVGGGDGQVNLLGHRVVRSAPHREAVEQRPPGRSVDLGSL
jgi:hypothetical protein